MRERGGILALDLGRLSGWAVLDAEGGLHSGWTRNGSGRTVDGGAFQAFDAHLRGLIDTYGLSGVWFEDVRFHRSVGAAQAFGGFRGITLAVAAEYGLPAHPVNTATLKNAVCGKGNARKADALKIAGERMFAPLGLAPETDDEADALMLLLYVAVSAAGLEDERNALMPEDEEDED